MKDLSKFASHIPVLVHIIENSKGNILELGMGVSTLLFHIMCKDRLVFSYENDIKWFKENMVYYSDNHKIFFINNWNEIHDLEIPWSIVFIDHRPAKDRRQQALYYKDKADFIIIHDSEPEIDKFYGYKSIYPRFKYVYHYTKCKPYTTVLSNTKKLDFLSKEDR